MAAALVHRAVGDQLVGVFVDNGLLRKNEREDVDAAFRKNLGVQLVTVNAIEEFMDKLQDVTDPEQKRKIIGETFIRVFEEPGQTAWQTTFSRPGHHLPGCG